MTRGLGRLQRQIETLLVKTPMLTMSRSDLEAVLVNEECNDPANVRRAILALKRRGRVGFSDQRDKSRATIYLARVVLDPLGEDEVYELLRQAREQRERESSEA